jgi:transcriptional regulator with XRE-family HTH domain
VDFTELLRHHLEKAGLSHAKFAERVGVTGAFVSLLATRKSKLPTEKVDEWADALRLKGEDRARFVEAAHLAKATDEVRALVRRLRLEAAKDHGELVDLRAKFSALVAHLRAEGHKLPKGLGDV